jgi:hypothetical protein
MTTALRYRSSTDNTYNSFLLQQPLACEASASSDHINWFSKAAKLAIRSTVTAGIVLSPAFAEAAITPTNPPVASIAAQTQEKLAFAVYQFDLASTKSEIFNFLKHHHGASNLLAAWPTISGSVFESDIRSKLEVLLDREANKQVMTIEIHTGIEDEEAFFEAEEKLFNLIETCNLERGLENVVLSLY